MTFSPDVDTSVASLSEPDSSLPDPHARGYSLQGQSSGSEPIDATDWSPSEAWTAGAMISTVEDLLTYGRALGTGEGLLSPKQQAERLDSFVSDLPPLNQPPLAGNLAYGLGLGNDRGWVGHNGEIPGYNTYLFYHPELDAVVAVEVNSDISSGDCPTDTPTMKDGPQDIICAEPADRIFRALAEAQPGQRATRSRALPKTSTKPSPVKRRWYGSPTPRAPASTARWTPARSSTSVHSTGSTKFLR